jgi:ribonuclease T1
VVFPTPAVGRRDRLRGSLVAPAVVAPTTTAGAEAAVYSTCTQSRCTAARTAYDVYPRARGAARDAYRIVVNRSTRETWFTPDHYLNFSKL